MLVVDTAPVMFFSLVYCSFGRRSLVAIAKARCAAAREPASRRLNILSAPAIVNDMRSLRGAAPADNAAVAARVDRCCRTKKAPLARGFFERARGRNYIS